MHNSIHKFTQGGRYFVLDICSGGVHVVDELVYNMLDYIEPPMSEACPEELFTRFPDAPREDISDCYGELYSLYADKILFSEDAYRKYAETSVAAPIKALCLHVAHDCNLRCKYCFADTGSFHQQRLIMAPETGRKAIDFLIEKSGNRENLELDFFGGEPLMAWDTVVETVKYARSIEKEHGKNFRFTITTNGMLLSDDKIDFINKEMVNCVLSIDGRKEVNDNIRVTESGKGSYDIIVPKFKKLVEGRVNPGRTDYYTRGTFTKYNLDFAADVAHMAELGFKNVSVEPVVTDQKYPYALREEDIPTICKEYDKLYDYMEANKGKFVFFHFMLDLNQGPCVIKRLRGCGCGNEYVAVTPEGDIYPCHQFVGIEEWKMGSVYGGDLRMDIKDYFSKTHIYSKQDCPDCWARFYCSGGCNANAFLYEGDVRKPHKLACALMKKRLECAIAYNS